jgi:myo-inositol catabolism protein IolC
VLGAGSSNEQVLRWLRVAAEVEGYAGFAIGRSIWRTPIRKHLAGQLSAAEASSLIADRYLEFVRAYLGTRVTDGMPLLAEGTD